MTLLEAFPKEPPVLKIISPDMDPETVLAIHHMTILKKQNWNECLSLLDVLKTIENIVKKIGSPRENWSPLEKASFELGVLLEVQSQILYDIDKKVGDSGSLPMFGVTAERGEETTTTTREVWKKGTGYGHGHQSQMNISKVISDSQKKMKSIEMQVATFYDAVVLHSKSDKLEDKDKERGEKILELAMLEVPSSTISDLQKLASEEPKTLKAAEYIIKRSTFIPAILSYLKSASLFDYDENKDLFGMIEQIAKVLQLTDILVSLERWNFNSSSSASKRSTPGKSNAGCSSSSTNSMDDTYASLFDGLHVEQCEFARPIYAKYTSQTSQKNGGDKSKAPKTTLSSKSLSRRALLEMKILAESLTISASSSAFVRQNEADLTQFKILIVPAEDTPYAYGCYIFNVVLPTEYPSVPPSVQLETTDGGKVRFNPNLYNCGKVCLSLLGTWHGGGEAEGWNANLSNLLAVVLSIQALIFIAEPYFNEPGYERSRGTKKGDEASAAYTRDIQQNNVRVAIIKQYTNPAPEFKEVIQKHFVFHKNAIRKKIKEEWNLSNALVKAFDETFGK